MNPTGVRGGLTPLVGPWGLGPKLTAQGDDGARAHDGTRGIDVATDKMAPFYYTSHRPFLQAERQGSPRNEDRAR